MGKFLICCAIVLFMLGSFTLCLDLDSFLLEALDDTRIALEKTRKVETVRPSVPKGAKKKRPSFGGRRRRYRSGRPGARPSPPKRAAANKHLLATNQIEKGIREAGAMSRGLNVNNLKQHIQIACRSREYIFARQMLGHTIFNYANAEKSRRRGKRATSSPANTILLDIKKDIGQSQFRKLMALDGMVTLAFAIDTTGSMHDDIKDSIDIAKDIVNYPRSYGDVDYILSPFNDPLAGPATYYKTSGRFTFLDVLGKLKASGGGDCQELAIEGIQNIYTGSPQPQSPIYVFTDAGAKDATVDNLEALKPMADLYQTAINFFLSNRGCMTKKAIKTYESLADDTGGQILYFSGKSGLKEMSNYVQNGLIGGVCLPPISTYRPKRSIGSTEYEITVDNSMDTLSATVMTGGSSSQIQLRNPAGTLEVRSKTDTGKGSLFLVSKPTPGVWKLTVPPSSDGHFVTARGVSDENIDFEYFFIVESRLGRKTKRISAKSPLKGKQASIVVTVPAHEKTRPSSFKIQVVNSKYKLPITVTVRQQGRAPGRYAGQFLPPRHDFKLILEGLTKEGRRFKRTSPGAVKASTALIHVFAAPRGFVLSAGSSMPTTILFAVNNFGRSEAFDVKIKEMKKYVQRYTKRLYVVSGRMSLFPVTFKAPGSAKRGATHDVVVSVVGQRSRSRQSMLVQLLII